ncbi:MAG: Gfo/Idh/MocA family oxidoreductase [Kiritimatiellales bacterium]|nr:Gfo/Idh/MocA family oxidoreductase [Pontiella sp.]NNJ69929.1 Gfo/Idh/MocA family oxidoreductase [Kiritimatiellales bacterium]
MKKWISFILLLPCLLCAEPLKIGVAGLVHGHANNFFKKIDPAVIQIVGIVEPDATVAQKYAERFNLDEALFFPSLDALLKAVKPEAVVAFSTTKDHLTIVEACAPAGVHVMVEKPLALNLSDAERIAALVRKHGIHVLTNYATTWYPTTEECLRITRERQFGTLRKVVIHDGNPGPYGRVPDEFFAWIKDPKINGGGALMDFGCYGACIMTGLMNNRMPLSVTAVTQQMRPDLYPDVEDEATIILTYPDSQCIIQASWNWPVGRKDIEIYGETGYARAIDAKAMALREAGSKAESLHTLQNQPGQPNNPLDYLAAVVRDEIDPTGSLSSIENGLIAMHILDAARASARTGKTVQLPVNNSN